MFKKEKSYLSGLVCFTPGRLSAVLPAMIYVCFWRFKENLS